MDKEAAFFEASERGDITEAKKLLKHVTPSRLNEWRASEERTILHVAIVAGDQGLLEGLVEKLRLNAVLLGDLAQKLDFKKMKDNRGDTPLHVAVKIYSGHMVKQLVVLKTDLCNCENQNKETPLDIAIKLQFVEAVDILIPNTKNVLDKEKSFVLHRVVSLNQVKLLEIFIKFSKKLDLSKLIEQAYKPAINHPQTEDYEGNPPTNPQTIREIVGETPLQGTVRNIYEHEKLPTQPILGETPLQAALRIIYEHEKPPTHPIVVGDTPLHIAARNKYERMVDLLLKVDGVNKHVLNAERKTPLDIAREVMEYHESFRIIRKLGDFKRKVKPFMYCAPQVSYEKHKRAGDMINRTYNERRNAELVVAALLATMTFTAAFTVPGGFQTDTKQKDELGSPVLISFTSFRLFLTFDCIAFFLSLFACIMWQMTSELTVGDKLLFMTINSGVVVSSFGFTACGFMAAIYTVLEHKVNSSSWAVLVILIFITLCGIFASIYQSARFAVSRARFLRLCGAPYLLDDLVELVWKLNESSGFLDILRCLGDKFRGIVSGHFKPWRTRTLCGSGDDRTQNCSNSSSPRLTYSNNLPLDI